MKKLLICVMVAAGMFAALPLSGAPVDLLTAYERARDYDARLGAARADNKIYKEEVGKAKAQLRPNVRMNAARGRNATEYTSLTGKTTSSFYNSINYGVSVRQPLFNLSSYAGYKQAMIVAEKSDVELQKEDASLIVRVTEAYCNALYAEDNYDFSQALIKAAQEQLQQAKRRYEKGFGTITEINESQAGYDMALADGLEIVNSVEFSRREIEHLTGVYPDELCKIAPEKLVLSKPDPNNVQSWIDIALANNYEVVGGRQEIQIAKREIDKQKFSRYPTVDLVGGRNYSQSENNYSIGAIYNTYSIGVQMSMPVYTGGYASSSVRQARAKWLKAQEQLSAQERGVQSDVRKYYNGVISGVAQIHAYEQALKSHEVALNGTKKGFEAGLRSNVDVLDAQQKLFSSRRNLAKSRYQYILNRLMLKQASGTLSSGDLEEVSSWLSGSKRQS